MPDVEAELRARAESDSVEFFFAMFVDMHGKPCAKMIPATALDVLLGGAGFAGFAAGPMGQSPADPDMIAVPDPASYTLVPWQPGLAVLQCDIQVEGEPWPYTPRLILKGMVEKARERGYVYNVGCEAEYFLVRRRDEGGIELADPLDKSGAPCYDAKGLTRMFDHLSTVSRYMNQLGWANYANDHEDANGQFEQNFAFSDALTSADRLIFFRYMVHTIAHRAGMAATFMPKPFENLTGSGLHLHSSLWDAQTGAELFTDSADPRGLDLSQLAYQYIGGLIEHGPAMAADNLHVVPAEEVARRGIRVLPPTLLHAADELVTDDVLRAALGKTPDGDYVDYYAKIKREEFHTWHSVVSDWETERYLTLF